MEKEKVTMDEVKETLKALEILFEATNPESEKQLNAYCHIRDLLEENDLI
jgi:hypothetical protein